MKKKIILFLLGILVLFFVIKFAGFENIYQEVQRLDTTLFVLALGLHFFIIGLRSFRWKLLLAVLGDNPPFHRIYRVVSTGICINNITPGRVAGDPMRAFMLISDLDRERKFSTIIIEKMIDLLVLASITTISLGLLFHRLPAQIGTLGMAAAVFILSMIIFFYYSVLKGKLVSVASTLLRPLPLKSKKEEILEFVKKAQNGVREIRHPMVITTTAVLSLICWLLEPLRLFIIFKSLNYEISFVTVVVVYLFSLVLGMIPITPGGIGTIEGFMILSLKAFNVELAVATTATLLDRFITFWLTTLFGAITGISLGIKDFTRF